MTSSRRPDVASPRKPRQPRSAPHPGGRRIRVLVVDDSLVARTVVGRTLAGEPDIEVVGYASNGALALERCREHTPDVVVLDVEMPGLSGLDVLRALRAMERPPAVVMLSAKLQGDSMLSLECLGLGAAAYVPKPPAGFAAGEADEFVREFLVTKIRRIAPFDESAPAAPSRSEPARRRLERAKRAADAGAIELAEVVAPSEVVARSRPRERPARVQRDAPVEVVAIAASTGGPTALRAVLSGLPAGFPVPILIVQHMPPIFTERLARQLDASSALRVREAAGSESLRAGDVWLAPGDRHLCIDGAGDGARIALSEAPPENSCRPPADVLFRCVARAFGVGVLAVVLTGMGQDGLVGSECIVAAGGRVIAQDQDTSSVWGMPRKIEEAGLADVVLPLGDIAAELRSRVRPQRGEVAGRPRELIA
jgi:two-component system chemotaxis response regulator CheB